MRKALYIVSVLLMAACFTSCRTTKSLEKEKEYIERVVEKHDTLIVYERDSIYHTIFQKGDTVYNTKFIETIRYKDRIVNKTDTLYRDREVYKEKEITKKVIPSWCWWLLGINALIICIIGIKFYFKWQTKI